MQISHRHKLIHCSQYGDYCRIDSFGDIPGQVDSLFWGLRILWTIKSALGLVSGLSLLIVKKFPCGEQMVREANGQNKLRFSQVFWTLFLVVTVSHVFSKCGNVLQVYEKTYLKRRSFSLTIRYCIYFVAAYFLQFYLEVIVRFGFSSEVEVACNYFSYRSILASVRNYCIFSSSMQLFICFHRPVIFPDLVIFPVFSGVNVHFLFFSSATSSMQISTHISKLFERTMPFFLFHQFSHSQQVHEPAYK